MDTKNAEARGWNVQVRSDVRAKLLDLLDEAVTASGSKGSNSLSLKKLAIRPSKNIFCFSNRNMQTQAPFFSQLFFPQQRKLMGSSAQMSSGVCRCGLQEQVPEEGSRRFRRVAECAGVGSRGRFRKVLEGSGGRFREVSGVCRCRFRKGAGVGSGSGVCRRRFRKQVPEGSGRFPVCAGVGSGGRFRKVMEGSGVCCRRFRRQVPEGSGVCWCRFRRQVPEGYGGFRCVLP